MPSSSHANCKICRKRIHKRNRWGLCPQHYAEHKHSLQRTRTALRDRRAARRQENSQVSEQPEPALIEQDVVVEVVKPARPARDRLAELSDDTKLIIAAHYANYAIPVERIVQTYGVANGDITRIADELGIARRDRRNVGKRLPPGDFDENNVWVVEPESEPLATPKPEPDIPQDTAQALEQMFADAEKRAPVLPTAPEPVLRRTSQPAQPAPLRVAGHYVAQVVGEVDIESASMIEALTELQRLYPQLRVQQIRELWPGITT